MVRGGAGAGVAEAGKADWVWRLAAQRLREGRAVEREEVRKGFCGIVPPPAVEGFSAAELEWLLCGPGATGIEDWKGHTTCPGVAEPASVCVFGWFWEGVEGLPEEEHSHLLPFATRSCLPPSPKVSHSNIPDWLLTISSRHEFVLDNIFLMRSIIFKCIG